jgi:hypothetical protein
VHGTSRHATTPGSVHNLPSMHLSRPASSLTTYLSQYANKPYEPHLCSAYSHDLRRREIEVASPQAPATATATPAKSVAAASAVRAVSIANPDTVGCPQGMRKRPGTGRPRWG